MTPIEHLIADYEHLAFPEDDAEIRKVRRAVMDRARKQYDKLVAVCEMARDMPNWTLDTIKNLRKQAHAAIAEAEAT